MQLKENLVEALIGAAVLVVAGLFVSYAYTRTEAGQGQAATPSTRASTARAA
nr:hypothetical protein [Hankyongella ginsenosidimutans]